MSDEKYESIVAQYEALMETHPEIERKGQKMPYTSVNGQMFSFVSAEGEVGLRLPEDKRQAFIEKYETRLAQQSGTTMTEYVAVPESLLADPEELAPHLADSYEYTKSIPLKPNRRDMEI